MHGGVTLWQLLFASMAGYGFAKKRFPGKEILFWVYVSSLSVRTRWRLHDAAGRADRRSTPPSTCWRLVGRLASDAPLQTAERKLSVR